MEDIFLKTSDGVRIAADIYDVARPKGWVVFLHMMPAMKESWRGLAQAFVREGYAGIAIDLRGHGKSVHREIYTADHEPLDYQKFSDEEHQRSILDVEAAVAHCVSQGAKPDQISFIGASFGANLALQYMCAHPEFLTAILLSPGLDYRGIIAKPLACTLHEGQRVLFVSSFDDDGNAKEVQELYEVTPPGVKKDIIFYETAGHGTMMLAREPALQSCIIQFF